MRPLLLVPFHQMFCGCRNHDGLNEEFTIALSYCQMLAREILEDNLLSTLSDNVPDVEIDTGLTSGQVITDSSKTKRT